MLEHLINAKAYVNETNMHGDPTWSKFALQLIILFFCFDHII